MCGNMEMEYVTINQDEVSYYFQKSDKNGFIFNRER